MPEENHDSTAKALDHRISHVEARLANLESTVRLTEYKTDQSIELAKGNKQLLKDLIKSHDELTGGWRVMKLIGYTAAAIIGWIANNLIGPKL